MLLGRQKRVIKKRIEVCINIKGMRSVYFLHVQKSKVVHGIHLSVGSFFFFFFLFCLRLDPVQTQKSFASAEIGQLSICCPQPVPLLDADPHGLLGPRDQRAADWA